MNRKTAIEKAIEAIDADIAVLQLAKAKLLQQQKPQTTRRPRVVPAKDEKQSA